MKMDAPAPKKHTRNYFYVSGVGLNNLKNYAYIGKDRSIVAKMLQPWWNRAVLWLPIDMAPNMVTLTGFFFIIASFLIQYYYTPNLVGYAPAWVYYWHAFSVFAYQTFDALDGKQARRTKTSSPLGELFDHGCDSITTSLMMLTVIGSMQVGGGWFSFTMLLFSLVAFYIAQWEEYYTGVLDLGYFNVTEAQITVIGLYTITGFAGPEFWNKTLTIMGYEMTYKYIPGIISMVMVTFAIFENFHKIGKTIKEKRLEPTGVYAGLSPVIETVLLSILWAYYSPQNVMVTRPYSFMLAVGLLFSFLVGRIVVARVTQVKFESWQPVVLPLLFAMLNAIFKEVFVSEAVLTPILATFYIGAFLHLSLDIIQSFCEYLDIYCLTIKHKKV